VATQILGIDLGQNTRTLRVAMNGEDDSTGKNDCGLFIHRGRKRWRPFASRMVWSIRIL
jgi:hypothetical protein